MKRILVFAASNGDEMESRSGLIQTRHRGTRGRKPHDGIPTPGRRCRPSLSIVLSRLPWQQWDRPKQQRSRRILLRRRIDAECWRYGERTGAVLLMEPAREENCSRLIKYVSAMSEGSVSGTGTLCLCGQTKQSYGYQFPEGISEFTLCRLKPLANCHSLRDRFLSGPFSWVGHIAKDFV